MLKQIVIATLLFAGLSACKSESAFNYSENIIAKEKSLLPDISATENKIENFITSDQYDSIAVAGAKMEGLVQKKIDEIEAMPLPKAKNAGDFKEAAIRYFKFIKKMYTAYKDWGNAQTEEQREQELNKIRDILKNKQKAIDDMQKVQRKFADANGFRIE